MQLLIVHDDAEVGEQLAGMVADYTGHTADLLANDAAAQQWAQKHAHCDLLLAQLDGNGVDGLALGGALSEIFSGLQVLFLPSYPASEQRLEIGRTKVFPEPIDGERLLEAIETAAGAERGAPDLFHVLDVLQMCCLSKRSGAVQVVNGAQTGIVYLRDGKIVHAEGAVTRGTEAFLEIAGWGDVEFAYDASVPRGRDNFDAVGRSARAGGGAAPEREDSGRRRPRFRTAPGRASASAEEARFLRRAPTELSDAATKEAPCPNRPLSTERFPDGGSESAAP
jgi:CheY-like chemotaxis protein